MTREEQIAEIAKLKTWTAVVGWAAAIVWVGLIFYVAVTVMI